MDPDIFGSQLPQSIQNLKETKKKKKRPEESGHDIMRFCTFDRFKALLATDEPHEWSEGQRSGHLLIDR